MQEYLSNELAFDTEDEKRLFRSKRKAEKKVKTSKEKRFRDLFQSYPGYISRLRASSDSTFKSDSRYRCSGSLLPGFLPGT